MSETKEEFEVKVTNRHELCMNQILHIIRFDNESITLMSREGKVLVEGNELKVENLSRESGNIIIVGEIISITFSNKKPKSMSFFGGSRE